MLQILDLEQGSPEWFSARAGMPTASEFSTVMAAGRGGGESKTRRTYMLKLAGEIITGAPMESYSNAHMERGKALEQEARLAYQIVTGEDAQTVGFITDGVKGYSPDSLVGENGLLEIKTQAPHLMIDTLLADKFPLEHVAQCQGGLWVAEREWIDLAIYCHKSMPLFIKRAFRDEVYIARLAEAVGAFNAELLEVVEKVKRYGLMEKAA